MKTIKKLYLLAIVIVFLACFTPETEARRKILRGRKTITRTYYRENILPAWAINVIIAFCQIIFGAILYVILKKVILDKPITGSYAPTSVHRVAPSV